ncbi:MAG TPA: hypothetical protein VLK32_05540 [Bacillota bacterium]|nr:hypothetical protein [Bacillota bacterium]
MRLALLGAIVLSLFIVGRPWLFPAAEPLGRPVEGRVDEVAVARLVAEPSVWAGRTVAITGRITLTCVTGCWFQLTGADGARILVDLAPAGLLLPRNPPARVRVYGHVLTGGELLVFEAMRVEFDP